MKYIVILAILCIILTGCSQLTSDFTPEKITYLSYGGSAIDSPFAVTELIITNETVGLTILASNGSLTYAQTKPHSSDSFADFIQLFSSLDYFSWKDIQRSSIPSSPGVGVANITVEDKNNFRTVLFIPNSVSAHGPQQQIILERLQSYVRSFTYSIEQVDEPELLYYTYQPTQCNVTQWNQWYVDGNINYVIEPSEIDLIYAYYGSQNIDIEDVQLIPSNEFTCSACGCNESFYFEAQSYDNITGWQLINNSEQEE